LVQKNYDKDTVVVVDLNFLINNFDKQFLMVITHMYNNMVSMDVFVGSMIEYVNNNDDLMVFEFLHRYYLSDYDNMIDQWNLNVVEESYSVCLSSLMMEIDWL
jgi:hypothetical protein